MELIAPYRKSGIVLDIGTGDGRFVSASAMADSSKFYIGIDANAKPLEKVSTKITRKPAKGGLPNAMFVQAAVEDLPEEFEGLASAIYINFPWGSLLRTVATGDPEILASFRRIVCYRGKLRITIGIDPIRDRAEFERLGIRGFSLENAERELLPKYLAAGFRSVERRELSTAEWNEIKTSWARKLKNNPERQVIYLTFEAC